MPTFDIVSEVDMQEVRNAVDQANREAATRFDFKNTDSAIELGENELVLRSSTEDRLRALHQVLDEKLVKRQVSLKAFEDAKVEEAQKGTSRQKIAIRAGISSDHAKRLNKFIKDLGLKGVSSQTQGDQLRVTGKKRDDLQEVIASARRRTSASRCSSTTSGTESPGPASRPSQLRSSRRPRRSAACTFSAWCSSYSMGVDVEELVVDHELHDPQDGEADQVGQVHEERGGPVAEIVRAGDVTGDPDGQTREGQADEGEDPEGGDLAPEV